MLAQPTPAAIPLAALRSRHGAHELVAQIQQRGYGTVRLSAAEAAAVRAAHDAADSFFALTPHRMRYRHVVAAADALSVDAAAAATGADARVAGETAASLVGYNQLPAKEVSAWIYKLAQ